jgi:LPXTG-motif cell wall-anchored protein
VSVTHRSDVRFFITQRVDFAIVTAYGDRMSLRRTLQFSVALLVGCFTLLAGTAAGADHEVDPPAGVDHPAVVSGSPSSVNNPDYTAPPPTASLPATTVVQRVQRITTAAAVPSRQRMPITGADVTQLAIIGVILLAGGSGLLVVRRRSIA